MPKRNIPLGSASPAGVQMPADALTKAREAILKEIVRLQSAGIAAEAKGLGRAIRIIDEERRHTLAPRAFYDAELAWRYTLRQCAGGEPTTKESRTALVAALLMVIASLRRVCAMSGIDENVLGLRPPPGKKGRHTKLTADGEQELYDEYCRVKKRRVRSIVAAKLALFKMGMRRTKANLNYLEHVLAKFSTRKFGRVATKAKAKYGDDSNLAQRLSDKPKARHAEQLLKQRATAKTMRENDKSIAEIARAFSRSERTILRWLADK